MNHLGPQEGADIRSQQIVSYWNVNVPQDEWTTECPDYLANVDEADRAQLAVPDHDYHPLTWPEVRFIICTEPTDSSAGAHADPDLDTNHLELFKRKPSDLRAYREYMAKLKEEYGSVMNFMLRERLRWQDLTPRGEPFEHLGLIKPDDIKILRNDWPYGLDPKIVHLVVWTKFGFKEDLETGDLTTQARKQIDDFVSVIFRNTENFDHVSGHASQVILVAKQCEQVLWFKNWTSLKSIHAVEHFHVLLYDPDPAFVKQVIGSSGESLPNVAHATASSISSNLY